MKSKTGSPRQEDLRMNAADFDKAMRRALQAPPPPKKPAKPASTVKAGKKKR